MRAIRWAGNAALWVLAVLGVLSAGAWGATQVGWIDPLVVVSGSMQPAIMTGDLVVATPHATSSLRAGQVASLRSAVSGKIITHRVVDVGRAQNGTWNVHLKGDANRTADAETYVVGDRVQQPVLKLPGAGAFLVTLTRPTVAVPLAVTLLALLGLTWLSPPPRSAAGARVEARTAS